ncbi:MAG: hypothetical protein ABIA63_15495, partial [bacterium]
YPDALVPWEHPVARKTAGFKTQNPVREIPDFKNRIGNGQKCAVLWVDIFVPKSRNQAGPGHYLSKIKVFSKNNEFKHEIKLGLFVWDFELPDKNKLAGNIFNNSLKNDDPETELKYYQLLKQHRVTNTVFRYRPGLSIKKGKVNLDWKAYDKRLKKYLDGSAFTGKCNYNGPGYGIPIEQLYLPFDCERAERKAAWPILLPKNGKPSVSYELTWIETIKKVRSHILLKLKKYKNKYTELVNYMDGLDELYTDEAYEKTLYYGKLFRKWFPELLFRTDGGHNYDNIKKVASVLDIWLCHTARFELEPIKEVRKLKIRDWFYGPMIYEKDEARFTGSGTYIDIPLQIMRGMSWTAWKYDSDSWCFWEFDHNAHRAWYDPESFKDYFAKEGGIYRNCQGNGMLIYRGNIMGIPVPVPSIRLKALRSGIQEYEYLKILSAYSSKEKIDKSIVNKLVLKPMGKQSLGNINVFDMNPLNWDNMRIEIGKKIHKMRITSLGTL